MKGLETMMMSRWRLLVKEHWIDYHKLLVRTLVSLSHSHQQVQYGLLMLLHFCAIGPVVFSPFMQQLPALLSSPQWQHRHAGLSAIASIAEGCIDNMMDQLKNLMKSILKAMKDAHPRVQYAAIYAVGQLCTDLGGYVQDEFGVKVLTALMQVTTGKEPRYV